MKTNKDNIILIIIGIAVAVLIINQYPNILQFGAITPISVSNVIVEGEGAKIIVTAIPQGATALNITFSPSNLNSGLSSYGYKATTTSILNVNYLESNKKFYWTDNPDNALRTLEVIDTGNYYGWGTSKLVIIDYCKDKGYSNTISAYFTDTEGLAITNVNCVSYSNEGEISAFNTGLGTDGFKVEFDIDGEKGYITGDEQYISMAGGKAKISWVGSLLGINNIGSPTYQVYHVGTNWKLVDANAYTNIGDAFNSFIICMDSTNWLGTRPNLNDYNSCQSIYIDNRNTNLVSKNSEYISQTSNILQEKSVEGITLDGGVMFVNLKQPTFKPVFTIELDATKVGLIKLTGDPVISSCIPKQDLDSAGTRVGIASIKNNGSQEGYFDFKITCTDSEMSGHADSLNFLVGATKSVSFQLYGGNSGTSTNSGVCTLKVTDRTSQKSVSCNYDMNVAYNPGISECTGTETRCSGDLKSLSSCVSGNWSTTACNSGYECSYISNIAQCVNITNITDITDNGATKTINGAAKTITITEYYSISDEDFISYSNGCDVDSDCSLLEGYNVSCIKEGDFYKQSQKRIYNYYFKKCKDETPTLIKWVLGVAHWASIEVIPSATDLCGDFTTIRLDITTWWAKWFKSGTGICVAKSTKWYLQIWEQIIIVIGSLGLPAQWVMLSTIGIIIGLILFIINFTKR